HVEGGTPQGRQNVVHDMKRSNSGDDISSNGLPGSARELLERTTLIVASNRGPVEFQIEDDGSYSTRRGSGGVVTAVGAVSRYSDLIWVASAMTEGDRRRAH